MVLRCDENHLRLIVTFSLQLLLSVSLFTHSHRIITNEVGTTIDGEVVTSSPYSQSTSSLPSQRQCSLYLSISNLTTTIGRGIFTGTDIDENEIIDTNMSLLIPYDAIASIPQLDCYVFDSGDPTISIIAIGNAAFYNSHINQTVSFTNAPYETMPKLPSEMIKQTKLGGNDSLPFLNYTDIVFITLHSHYAGEELFSYYGEDWYDTLSHHRTMVSLTPDEMHVPIPTPQEQREYLEITSPYHRVCMDDVIVRLSTLSEPSHLRYDKRDIGIGRGLFANRDFKQGDAITVSPVAVLNKTLVDSWSNVSVIQNYCLWDGHADVVLLPMSYVAMINHQSSPKANVVINWFSWFKRDTLYQAKERVFAHRNITELLDSPIVPLDVVIHATRDIHEGEELFLDYGKEWEERWLKAECNEYSQLGCGTIGTFRSYIYVSKGFFPIEWSTG